MRYLVTGSAGMIGSHLTDRLLAEGHDVIGVDNFSSSVWTHAEVLDYYSDYTFKYSKPTLMFYAMTLSVWYATQGVRLNNLDGVFHLASPVGPAAILKYGGNMVKTITDDLYDMLDLAIACHCRIVYISTSEIYGGVTGDQGLAETDPCVIASPFSIRTEYGVAKLAAEVAALNTTKLHPELELNIIRPFNCVGPRQNANSGFVLPRFVQQALSNQPLTIFGDGTQLRAFTHVKDVVDGLVLAMQRGGRGEIYNLGNVANQTSIYDLAQSVLRQMYTISDLDDHMLRFCDGKEIYGPLYEEAKDKWPNASKAIAKLGWLPRYSIQETIADVIAYERSRVKA